jgi:hypothetical protein
VEICHQTQGREPGMTDVPWYRDKTETTAYRIISDIWADDTHQGFTDIRFQSRSINTKYQEILLIILQSIKDIIAPHHLLQRLFEFGRHLNTSEQKVSTTVMHAESSTRRTPTPSALLWSYTMHLGITSSRTMSSHACWDHWRRVHWTSTAPVCRLCVT